MDRIGSILLANAKANVSATSKSGAVEKSDIVGRDLLSLLVKANMATDLKEEQKMSDEDVLARAFRLFLVFFSDRLMKSEIVGQRDSNFSRCRTRNDQVYSNSPHLLVSL
jgi:hypothetical protein